jgi:ribosomal-protein-alanine N-acetyltransferase
LDNKSDRNQMDANRQVKIRAARLADVAAIAAIQDASPEAAKWNPADYLKHDCRVGEVKGSVAGFLVTRQVGPDEREVLNLAVDPAERRTGIARELLRDQMGLVKGAWFLEVRASNTAAIQLYESAGFERAGSRPGYYREPAEEAIVMRFFS